MEAKEKKAVIQNTLKTRYKDLMDQELENKSFKLRMVAGAGRVRDANSLQVTK
jgi:hypothetical protein